MSAEKKETSTSLPSPPGPRRESLVSLLLCEKRSGAFFIGLISKGKPSHVPPTLAAPTCAEASSWQAVVTSVSYTAGLITRDFP